MIPVNASSFGRRRGMRRRYPGGTENDSILRTVLRSNPNTREAWRVLIPATRHARRTRAHISTRYIPPPSSQSNPDRRLYAVPFLVRRSRINRPASVGDYCAAVLTCPGTRISARVPRIFPHGAVVHVTSNARIGRDCRELLRESDMVAFQKGRPGIAGARRPVQLSANRKPQGSRWCASRSVCGECAAWDSRRGAARFGSERFPTPRERLLCGASAVFRETASRTDSRPDLAGSRT